MYHEVAQEITHGSAISEKIFTYGYFLDFLVLASQQAYASEASSKVTLPESLCLLLERMETSQGFLHFLHLMNKPHTAGHSLMPTQAMITAVK